LGSSKETDDNEETGEFGGGNNGECGGDDKVIVGSKCSISESGHGVGGGRYAETFQKFLRS
jgi:hypothetical protein